MLNGGLIELQTFFKPSHTDPSFDHPSGDPSRGRRPSERNRKPVRQRHRSLRSKPGRRSRYRSTCCDGRGCGYGCGGKRGNHGPASDGSTSRSCCRTTERNRTTVQRRTTVRRRRSERHRSGPHKPERRNHRSAQQPHRSLRSRSERRSSRCGPTCGQAKQPP